MLTEYSQLQATRESTPTTVYRDKSTVSYSKHVKLIKATPLDSKSCTIQESI